MIAGVALRHRKTGEIFSLPKPKRHHHLFKIYGPFKHSEVEQGFVTYEGKFLDRFEAKEEAEMCGQIINREPPTRQLFSENLW